MSHRSHRCCHHKSAVRWDSRSKRLRTGFRRLPAFANTEYEEIAALGDAAEIELLGHHRIGKSVDLPLGVGIIRAKELFDAYDRSVARAAPWLP